NGNDDCSWSNNDGGGDDIKLRFFVQSSIPPKFQHGLKPFTTFLLDIDINDCYRCCKVERTEGQETQGGEEGDVVVTNVMNEASLGDPDALKAKRKGQIKRLKVLKSEEAEALQVCKKELEEVKKLGSGDQEAKRTRKERAEETFRAVKEQIKAERNRMKTELSDDVNRAEKAWGEVGRMVLERCEWKEILYGKEENVYLNGNLVHRIECLPFTVGKVVSEPKMVLQVEEKPPQLIMQSQPETKKISGDEVQMTPEEELCEQQRYDSLSPIEKEFEASHYHNKNNFSQLERNSKMRSFLQMRKMKLDYQQTELKFKQKREAAKLKANEMKINKKSSGSQFVIALDCNIYQAVQKIGASSRGDQGYKSLLFTLSGGRIEGACGWVQKRQQEGD
ncbi:hypothetical protein ScalyP_jg4858, partial [Parmales sp. scaly parma]